MTQKLRFLILLFLITFIPTAHAQESSNLSSPAFEAALKNAGLSKELTNKIEALLVQKKETLVKNQLLQKELDSKYPYQFKDDEIEVEYDNKKFIRALSEIVTIDQFRKMFQPQLEYRIKRIADEKWELSKDKYKLTPDQERKYKALLYENTVNEIMVREYYNYDADLSWNNYTEEKLKSSRKELELIKSFGQLYSQNAKTDVLLKKLTAAKVDPERINQILLALQVLQERYDKRLKNWRENDAANIFNFHDPGEEEYTIYLDFREKLSKILSIEEFKTVFLSQLQNRILRESDKEFKILKATYTLSDAQYNEVEKLVTQKNTEKVVTEEYYKYSYELYQQKLRAVEYRHEKGIRETIQKFNESKP